MCFSGARGSRGTRQLKDFMGDGGGGRQQHSAGDQLSDGHEAVVTDDSDNEASRPSGCRGQGRPSRGRYSEMRQQDINSVSDVSERPRYSNARGRGFRNDGGSQRQGYGSRVNKRQEVLRDEEHRPEIHRGPGKPPMEDIRVIEDRRGQKIDDRQPTNTRSGQSQEEWTEETDSSHTDKPMEQRRERSRATASQPVDSRAPEPQLSYNDRRVSDSVHFQRQDDRQPPREPVRRLHPTRTISNRHYQAADNVPTKDRSSQIGLIVDAMNKISVRTAADDDKRYVGTQQNLAAKSAIIVTGMRNCDYFLLHFQQVCGW